MPSLERRTIVLSPVLAPSGAINATATAGSGCSGTTRTWRLLSVGAPLRERGKPRQPLLSRSRADNHDESVSRIAAVTTAQLADEALWLKERRRRLPNYDSALPRAL